MERDKIYTLRVLKLKSGSEDDMKLKFPEYKNIKHDDYKDKECGELINFLQKSRYLEILDLSGLVLTQKEFYELFKIIDQKPRLKDITIPIVEGLTPKELIAELSKMIGQNPKLSGIKISTFDGSKQKELKPEKLTVVSKKHAAGSDSLSEEASPESAVQKPLASQAATAAASAAAEDGDDNSPPPSRSH
jgi:hypothetical protein